MIRIEYFNAIAKIKEIRFMSQTKKSPPKAPRKEIRNFSMLNSRITN